MSTSHKCRALLSLNQVEYDSLLAVFAPLIRDKLSKVTLKGQFRLFEYYEEPTNCSLRGSKAKLNFLLYKVY